VDESLLTIGAFAAEAGVSVETVRYYQRKRLLREPPRPRGGIRRYGAEDVARVQFVKAAQRLGFRGMSSERQWRMKFSRVRWRSPERR
jgi:MerR family transcriptional regulator, mercuric resistance operon regulatory protein